MVSQLHVSGTGRICDSSGKTVYLRGVCVSGSEYGNAYPTLTSTRVNAVTSLLSLNLWRLPVNVSWWNNNILLTDGGTHYQSWIAQIITWIEQAGCYVEVDAGPSFCTAPSTPTSPSQDTQDACNATEALDVTAHTTFWQNFVPLYASDPAVLYNVMNEPTYSDTITQNQSLITTIQTINPSAVCMVYNYNYNQIVSGAVSDYTGTNLILDFHIYDDPTNTWQTKLSNNASIWSYAQAHGHGVMVGEFSIFHVANAPRAYAQTMAYKAITNGYALAYFNEFGLVAGDNATLIVPDGGVVAPAFQQIANYAAGNGKYAGF